MEKYLRVSVDNISKGRWCWKWQWKGHAVRQPLQAGPLYGAFPVAYLLFRKGASIRNIFIYLGAFSSMKIPMLGIEIGYLGIQFSLVRTLVSLPLFIGIGYLMEQYLKNKHFEVYDGGQKTEVPHENNSVRMRT